MSNLKEGTSEFLSESASIPAAQVFGYTARSEELREKNPNILLARGFDEYGKLLNDYYWAQSKIFEVFPWSKSAFYKYALRSLNYILNTGKARKTFREAFKRLDYRSQNANKLYSPKELQGWFRENLDSQIRTVLVPLTALSDRKEELRAVYKDYLRGLTLFDQDFIRRSSYKMEWLETWGILDFIRPEYRKLVGSWRKFNSELLRTGGRYPKMDYRTALLPADAMPQYHGLLDLGYVRNYYTQASCEITVRVLGFATHKMKRDGINAYNSYTAGLALGSKDCYEDYHIGLVDLWSVNQAVDVFGEDFLTNPVWRFSRKELVWLDHESNFSPFIETNYPLISKMLGLGYMQTY